MRSLMYTLFMFVLLSVFSFSSAFALSKTEGTPEGGVYCISPQAAQAFKRIFVANGPIVIELVSRGQFPGCALGKATLKVDDLVDTFNWPGDNVEMRMYSGVITTHDNRPVFYFCAYGFPDAPEGYCTIGKAI